MLGPTPGRQSPWTRSGSVPVPRTPTPETTVAAVGAPAVPTGMTRVRARRAARAGSLENRTLGTDGPRASRTRASRWRHGLIVLGPPRSRRRAELDARARQGDVASRLRPHTAACEGQCMQDRDHERAGQRHWCRLMFWAGYACASLAWTGEALPRVERSAGIGCSGAASARAGRSQRRPRRRFEPSRNSDAPCFLNGRRKLGHRIAVAR